MSLQKITSTPVRFLRKQWFVLLINALALIPLALLTVDLFAGRVIDPIAAFTNRTGYTALVLLVISLASTPIITLTGFRKGVVMRKWAGLQGFFYAALHLLVFIGLDYAFSLADILDDALLTKRYILVGFTAFVLLIPLALTSTKGWMRRLGKNWKRLHRLVYIIVPLAVLHYVWVEKIPVEPLIYGLVVALLLAARIPTIRTRLNRVRRRLDRVRRPERAPQRRTRTADMPSKAL